MSERHYFDSSGQHVADQCWCGQHERNPNMPETVVTSNKNPVTCLVCGHGLGQTSWDGTTKTCPYCGARTRVKS